MLIRVGEHDDWPTLGWEAIDFVEAYCPHGPGDVQGEPFVLDIEEVQLLLDLYRLFPADHPRAGRRVVSRALYSRAKGRRKSELAGALVILEARGPARFDGWGADGRPVGRPVTAPFIRCLATEESQSGNTYGNVVAMLEHGIAHHPDVFGDVDLGQRVQGSTRVFLRRDGGEIRPSTASSAAKDGGKESFVVEDEPHLYVTPELHRMDDVVRRNLMKRKLAEPWLFRTSTADRPGESSVAEEHHDHAKAILEGRTPEAGLYLNHREGPKVEDWDDDDEMRAALAESYGEFAVNMDLDRLMADEIRNPQAETGDSERYFLNRRDTRVAHAFDVTAWRALADPEHVFDGDRPFVVLSFDGARFHDSTALIATEISTGYQWIRGLWEQPFGADDWEVDEADVDAAVEAAFDELDVYRFEGDPPYWETSFRGWQGKHGEDIVRAWWTARLRPMAYAVRAFTNAIREGSISHDGDDRFAAHIGNARIKETHVRDDETGRRLHVIRKEFPMSRNKIDAATTAVIGWEARSDAIAAGALSKRHTGKALFF